MDRRQAAQLEWMRRNYALLTPEQRAIVDAADGRAPKDPTRSTAEVAFGDTPPNVESDLDAAATPMPAEPVVQPGRKRSRADWAVDSAVAGQLYTPSEQVAGMRVNDRPSARATSQAASDMGITPPGYDAWAEAMTDAETGTTRAERQAMAERTGRRIDEKKAAYDRATGLDTGDYGLASSDGYYDWSGWQPGMPLPKPGARAMRPGDGEVTPVAETVPGPRGVGGQSVRPPRPIYDADEAAGYQGRPFDTDAGRYRPSQKDRDMMERGMVPVLNEDGTVGYAVGYDIDPLAPGMPGGPGRAGRRVDLEEAGWGAQSVEGPLGPTLIYQPGPDARARYRAQADEQARVRIAKRAGISGAEAAGMTLDELRARARAADIDDHNKRNETWKAHAMLAGRNPRRNMVNAWRALGDEGLNDWQRLTMAKALRPDIDGTSPLTVDANSAKNAVRLLNAEMIGAGGLGDARAMMMQQQSRVAADEMAQREAAKLMGMFKRTLTRKEAERIRRRIEAVHPGMGGVVEGLPIDDDAPVVPGGVAPGSVPAV